MAYSRQFEKAFRFANKLHAEQTRKGSDIPYINHLMGVAALVGEAGGTEEQVIAALLHDAVEDQGGAPVLKKIRKRFGDTVAAIVEACTDTDVTPKPPWRERKEAYIAHLAHAPEPALLVSAADKLYNCRTIITDVRAHGRRAFERFKAGREGVLWYYAALVEAFIRRGRTPIVDELERCVEELLATDAACAGG